LTGLGCFSAVVIRLGSFVEPDRASRREADRRRRSGGQLKSTGGQVYGVKADNNRYKRA
jgi:hypothetical protein